MPVSIQVNQIIYSLGSRGAFKIMSSQTSKLVLLLSCSVTIGIVSYVHMKQQLDREKMHEGVVRDVERQQRRKIENLYLLQQQNELTKQLKKELEN